MVDNLDVLTHSLAVRQRIGYLPEHTPLYPDMRVGEYLRFRAHIKGVPRRERKARVAEVMQKTLITDRVHQLISALSKGYKQRVGIADALIGHPRLLILDEPTIGLDPNQVRQVRELIRELAQERTVILSTHILAEVEMICSRVVIIHKGQTVANDTIDNLISRYDFNAVLLELSPEANLESVTAELRALAEVNAVEQLPSADANQHLRIVPSHKIDLRPQLTEWLRRSKWPVLELKREHVSLEDVFSILTEGQPNQPAESSSVGSTVEAAEEAEPAPEKSAEVTADKAKGSADDDSDLEDGAKDNVEAEDDAADGAKDSQKEEAA